MNNKNFGIAKTVIANSLVDEFLNEGNLNNGKNITKEFAAVIKEYPSLKAEMKIVESIEGKTITSDAMATRFIDKSLTLINKFSPKEINEGYEAISKFYNEDDVQTLDESQVNLYNSISNLIVEMVKNPHNDDVNVDLIHESFETVLNYLKEDKSDTSEVNSQIDLLEENIDLDAVIKIATKKFNEKFSKLNEEQRHIINNLVYGDSKLKKEIFESLKKENLEKLTSMKAGDGIQDKIHEGIERLNKMDYADENSVDSIIKLYELKENLA